MELIYSYTRQRAIEDGVLVRLEEYLRGELSRGKDVVDSLESVQSSSGKFSLGELVITPAAAQALRPVDVLNCLMRHRRGDWGNLDEDDSAANDYALQHGERLFSAYHVENKNDRRFEIRFYIITEWNREATTVLLPEDY